MTRISFAIGRAAQAELTGPALTLQEFAIFWPHVSCGDKTFNPARSVMDLKYAMGAALAAGAFLTIPVIATADDSSRSGSSGRADHEFTRLDKNNDGAIDQTEAAGRPWLQQNFSQYDTNHDGKLGKDEFAAAVSAERTARRDSRGASGATSNASSQFDSLDKNNDGKLDPTEAQALPWLQQNFSQYDTNHDGTLGKDEFAAALSANGSR